MKMKRVGRIGVVALINACTAFIVVVAFSPHLIPFLRTEPQKFALPISSDVSTSAVLEPVEEVVSGKPIRLTVPSVTVDVEVVDGIYDEYSQTWTLEGKKAHYALITSLANNKQGNTFIYGHNNKHVFGRLLKAELGAEARVETDNGKIFIYKLTAYQDVKPNDVGALQPREKPVLTVQTCSGTWFENRRLFTFEFVRLEDK